MSPKTPTALISFGFLLVASACGPSSESLEVLARAGQVQPDAPLHSKHELVVQAPPSKVWATLVDPAGWPAWHKAVRSARATGPFAPGVTFEWNNEGTTVNSRVALARSPEVLAWTGSAWGAKAVHVWRLAAEGEDATRVTVEETMDGPLISLLFPQKKLDDAVVVWLTDLNVESERRAGAR
jgi:uncharacterized protein YndB with AHSA1/START domain